MGVAAGASTPFTASRDPEWLGRVRASSSVVAIRKADPMEITGTPVSTRQGPADWFTGQVWMDELATPPAPARAQLLRVHFSPGARTAWHRHPLGQVLYVTEGVGLVARRGAAPEVIRAGDIVRFAPNEEHWHGAGPEHFMTHLALHEHDADDVATLWNIHVTDEEYGQVPIGG